MSDEQARRVGENEALFRQVNEQIEAVNQAFGAVRTLTILCECADGDCTERIEIPLPDYERVRADPLCFVVAPGHEVPEFESVAGGGDGYDVVRKRPGTPRRVAAETDPRS